MQEFYRFIALLVVFVGAGSFVGALLMTAGIASFWAGFPVVALLVLGASLLR